MRYSIYFFFQPWNCIFYTQSTSQFGQTTFHVLSNCIRLVATTSDSVSFDHCGQ